MGDINVAELDLYELLGIDPSSTTKEIKTAYRKKALSCHPDKNPDDARAAERFHTLSKVLEILIDASARAAYDKVFNAKKIAKARHSQLDAKRKKLKEDLEAKEQASMRGPSIVIAEQDITKSKSDEDKLKVEIERLRKQGSRELKEEIERVNKQVEEEWRTMKKNVHGSFHAMPEEAEAISLNDCRLKIRWDIESGKSLYDEENLRTIFKKYGPISAIVVSTIPKKRSSKKGSGIIEFENTSSAKAALENEKGFAESPLTLECLQPRKNIVEGSKSEGPEETTENDSRAKGKVHFPSMATSFPSFDSTKTSAFPSFPVSGNSSSMGDDLDFESLVLRRLRQAQERKRLEEEMRAQDSESI
ncbi:dnaJ homolog subfamily C member 17 [Hetaerina americana]|uniref:dnaJ homolog subfamily C member 17 n=1 Tax=Hetaerina americana TaxID=62018 RepID=UPI003A7F2D44